MSANKAQTHTHTPKSTILENIRWHKIVVFPFRWRLFASHEPSRLYDVSDFSHFAVSIVAIASTVSNVEKKKKKKKLIVVANK